MDEITQVGVTFNGRPMSVDDQGATVGKEGKTKLFTLVRFFEFIVLQPQQLFSPFFQVKWGPVYTLYSDYNVVILYDGTFVEVNTSPPPPPLS